ncbi:MAG: SAM-dependent methyltransferase [Thermodesulfobacteriota bacterium]
MRKLALLLAGLTLLAAAPAVAQAPGPQPMLTISGLVKQPLRLDAGQLARLASMTLKLNDINSRGDFRGVFWLRGVPLRSLLELAVADKEAGGFNKLTDLAILVRSRDGRQVALSWGEVFHRNPADVIIALDSAPVMPRKSCQACHQPEVFQPWMDQLTRKVGLPKLAVAGDFFSDRSLEGVNHIEVVWPVPAQWGPKQDKLYAPSLRVELPGHSPQEYKSLPALPQQQVQALQVGEGKGFHGNHRLEGVALRDLLRQQKIKADLNSVFVISAPDGYQSLASYGELFLRPAGARIILADRKDGKPIEAGGRFELVFPDDLWADRWVKAVSRVQAVSLAPKARLFVIGMGCGDTSLLSLQALSYLAQAQVLVAPRDIQKRFAFYLHDKQVLFDPMTVGRKPFTPLGTHKKVADRKRLHQAQAAAAERIKKVLAGGRSVAVLDWGDPMVYGSWRWLADFVPKDQLTIVPGMSAFNAGSAALRRDITCQGAVAISDPFTLMKDPELAKQLAAKNATLVVFMGLPKLDQVLAVIKQAYPPQTPAAVVYRAGYAQAERVVSAPLKDLRAELAKVKEDWLGVIFVGPCLR